MVWPSATEACIMPSLLGRISVESTDKEVNCIELVRWSGQLISGALSLAIVRLVFLGEMVQIGW